MIEKTWSEIKEGMIIKIAWMLPRELAYWAFVRVASARVPEYMAMSECNRLTCLEAMENWNTTKEGD